MRQILGDYCSDTRRLGDARGDSQQSVPFQVMGPVRHSLPLRLRSGKKTAIEVKREAQARSLWMFESALPSPLDRRTSRSVRIEFPLLIVPIARNTRAGLHAEESTTESVWGRCIRTAHQVPLSQLWLFPQGRQPSVHSGRVKLRCPPYACRRKCASAGSCADHLGSTRSETPQVLVGALPPAATSHGNRRYRKSGHRCIALHHCLVA